MQCYVSIQPPIYPPSRDQQHAHTSVLSPSLLPVRMPLSCGICPPSRPPAPCLTGKPSRCRSASRRPTDGWAGSLSESGQRCPLQRVLRRLWRWLLNLNLARNLGPKQWAVHWARWRQRRCGVCEPRACGSLSIGAYRRQNRVFPRRFGHTTWMSQRA